MFVEQLSIAEPLSISSTNIEHCAGKREWVCVGHGETPATSDP
jgi:hypothetical protein